MSNTLAMRAVALATHPVPVNRALRGALRELEDAAYLLGAKAGDDTAQRYLTARALVYALLGLALED